MDKQTQQAFALGGLKDEGGEIDEASGNRVPIGGTKEGVRDDIPANVSEGEFIFPADVVRYHGLDKMMALRQEAKMGLKQMESMGQMGNSEEATMPDDLPFEMADLIVVGGQGEPMEFAEGGFVPQMQTLQTAPVPTMGGGTSTGTQTPIVYDDFMKTPVVTMQEYRDANGNSIIITSVNGKATTEIPSGYTLYVPPTNAAPTATQAVIQTANNYSYQTSGGGDEGSDTPRELQVDPDYASMDNDTYFSTMERQNSFGGKAGNAAAMGIALAMGPLGLLTMGMLRADKKRQLTSAEQRIAAETNPTKKKAYQATFAKMGGKTKEPEEENALVKFGKGFVAAVGGMFGLGNDDVEKVASVVGSAAAGNTNVVSAAPERSLLPQLRPAGLGASAKSIAPTESTMDIMGGVGTEFTSPPPTGTSTVVTQPPSMQSNDVKVTTTPAKPARPKPGESIPEVAQPTALPMNNFRDRPFDFETTVEGVRLAQLAGTAPTSDRTREILNRRLETGQFAEMFIPPAATQADPKTQRPLTQQELIRFPSGGVDDTAAIQAGMEPVAQAADVQPPSSFDLNRALSTPFNIDDNIYSDYDQQKEQNIYYGNNTGFSPQQQKDIYFSAPMNRQSDRVSVLEGQGFNYPISTSASYFASPESSSRVFKEPSYTTGQQTDAALGPQTNYGQRIANARGDSFIQQPNVQVAGLGDYVPDSIKNAFTSRVAPSLDKGQARANEILQRQAMEFGPQLPTIPRADPPSNLLGANAQAAAVTEKGISREPRGVTFAPQVDNRQVVADELREESLTMPSQIRQEPPTVLPDPAIQQTTVPRDAYEIETVPPQLVFEGKPYNPTDSLGTDPMPDPRDNVSNLSTGTGSQLQLGYGNFNAAEARQAAVDQTANAFGQIGSAGPTSVGNYATAVSQANPYLGEPFAAEKTKRYDAFGDEIKEVSTDIKDFATPMDTPTSKVKTKAKPSTAASTSKGTGTRKAAPTGDDRLSQANFLERALGITPAPISARRGNDGVLYRTQADKREADNRQEQAKVSERNQGRAAARASGGQAAVDDFNKANAADIEKRHGGDKENSNGKIVCSAMNNAYGFGSFRNKIWLEHSKNNLTKEHQVGYHRMFLPLIHLGYNKDYKFIRKCLEHIARHRTADIYFQSKSNKRDTLGMVYRTILEPICYLVGMFPTSKDNK